VIEFYAGDFEGVDELRGQFRHRSVNIIEGRLNPWRTRRTGWLDFKTSVSKFASSISVIGSCCEVSVLLIYRPN